MSIFDTTTSSGGVFGSSQKSGSLFDNETGDSSIFGSSNKLDLEVNDNLRFLAEQQGFTKKKTFNAIDAISRVLNFDVAAISGGIRGAIRPNETFGQGVQKGIKENIAFADVLREVVGTPETRAGKIALGTAGFAADILFSPLTYLSLGTSAVGKIGGKAVTKAGSKLAVQGAKEIREGAVSRTEQFIAEGVAPERAARLAESEAKRDINELFQKIVSKDGLTTESAEKFIEKGLNVGTAESISQLGKSILDQGGIKFFGKTLVSSKQLANTPIGKIAKRLGETEIVQAFKNTLGRAFVYNFGKNPEVAKIMYKSSVAQKRAIAAISEATDRIFKNTTEEEQIQLFDKVFAERVATVDKAREIEEQYLTEFHQKFPNLKVADKEDAARVLAGLEESTVKASEGLRKQIDEIVQPYFDNIESARRSGTALDGGAAAPFSKVNELNALKVEMQKVLSELRKARRGTGSLGLKSGKEVAMELGEDETKSLFNNLIKYQEEKLNNEVNNIVDIIRKLKETPADEAAKGVKGKIAKGSELEQVALMEKRLKQLQTDLTDQTLTLQKILGSKRLAKEVMRSRRLMFTENEKLQKVSDFLFEGDDSVVAKMAKTAGIPEVDAYKFYLPSIFKDVTQLKQFASGLSSPKTNFLKEFRGAEGEKQVRNAAEALKRGRTQVVTARLKSQTIKAMFSKGGIGKPLNSMTEAEAAKLGYKKMSRQLIDGKFEGWIPKEIAKDIDDFFEPKSSIMDDLAQVTGFDWATGLFKGYVTSLFPAFHMRNLTSNQFQLMLKYGVDSLDPAVQREAINFMADKILKKGGKQEIKLPDGSKITYKELLKKIQAETDFLDEGAFSDIEAMFKTVNASKTNWNPLSRNFAPMEGGRKIGTAIENYSKMVGIIASLKQGKTIKEAVKDAEDALFNYGKLTPFEKDFMRRVIPFYTWARKNFEYQVRSLSTTPGRTAAQIKFMNGIEESFGEPQSPSDKEGLPSWVIDRIGIKGSRNKYLTGFGLPIEEFMGRFSGDKGFLWNTISNTMVQMNPLLKFPIEKSTGVDLFRGRPITEITNGQSIKPLLDVMPKGVAKEFKELLQYKEIQVPRYVNGVQIGTYTKTTANPYALHLFRNLPTARFQQVMEFSNDPSLSNMEVITRFLTGVSTFSVDKEQAKFFKDLEEKDELVDFLKRMGIIGTKEIIYQK